MKKKQLRKLLKAATAALESKALLQPAPATAAVPVVAAGITLNSWIDTYEKILGERSYKPQTVKNRTANLKHVRRLWGERAIATIKPFEIQTGLREFIPDRTSTACRVLSDMRDIYNEAIANGCAETNPAAHVKMPKHKIQRCRLKFEVWAQMREVAKLHNQRWIESMLLLAIATGQRRADLAKMRFDDVVDGHLQVEQQKQAGKGYGARVSIPLTLKLNAIDMTVGDVIEHCKHSARSGPTLLRKTGGGSIEESSLSARFHEVIVLVLGKNAHAPYEWPSLHEVRSLSAREYDKQGEDVQTLLGHKNAEMTAVYIDDRGLTSGTWKKVVPKEAPALPVGVTGGIEPPLPVQPLLN